MVLSSAHTYRQVPKATELRIVWQNSSERVMAFRYAARGRPESKSKYGVPDEEITQQQEDALKLIQETDKEIDAALGDIELGMDELKGMAKKAGDEVKRQQGMIDNVTTNVEDVQAEVDVVNAELKVTMAQAQRGCDKIFCDAFCICLMVGLIVALIKVSEGL